MGKYNNYTLDYQTQKAGEEILLLIANELAEANRLKRLELRILAANVDIPNTMKEINEDRA